jgi:hypothetical protein
MVNAILEAGVILPSTCWHAQKNPEKITDTTPPPLYNDLRLNAWTSRMTQFGESAKQIIVGAGRRGSAKPAKRPADSSENWVKV